MPRTLYLTDALESTSFGGHLSSMRHSTRLAWTPQKVPRSSRRPRDRGDSTVTLAPSHGNHDARAARHSDASECERSALPAADERVRREDVRMVGGLRTAGGSWPERLRRSRCRRLWAGIGRVACSTPDPRFGPRLAAYTGPPGCWGVGRTGRYFESDSTAQGVTWCQDSPAHRMNAGDPAAPRVRKVTPTKNAPTG